MSYRIGLRTTLLTLGVTLSAAAPARAQKYTLTDFATAGVSAGGANGRAINASGQIGGTASGDPFVWTPRTPNGTTGTATVVPNNSTVIPTANALNASGELVGTISFGSTLSSDAFLFSNGTLTNLGFLSGDASSTATGINSTGLICGTSFGPSTYRGRSSHAFATTGGALTSLGSFGGGQSIADGVNDAGQIVGYASLASGFFDPFIWQAGVLTDMNGAGGFTPVGFSTLSINSDGQIAGSHNVVSGTITTIHPFLWTPSTPQGTSGSSVDLGLIPGGFTQCLATAVNNHGDVVGNCATGFRSSATHHAFLYHAGTIVDLSSANFGQAGVIIHYAWSINDDGQIVASATGTNVTGGGVLLTPAP